MLNFAIDTLIMELLSIQLHWRVDVFYFLIIFSELATDLSSPDIEGIYESQVWMDNFCLLHFFNTARLLIQQLIVSLVCLASAWHHLLWIPCAPLFLKGLAVCGSPVWGLILSEQLGTHPFPNPTLTLTC